MCLHFRNGRVKSVPSEIKGFDWMKYFRDMFDMRVGQSKACIVRWSLLFLSVFLIENTAEWGDKRYEKIYSKQRI